MTFWIISSSALLLVIIGLRYMLRGRINPVLQYALWALALLRLLIPGTVFKTTASAQNLVNRTQLVRDAETVRGFDHVGYSDDGTLTGYISDYIDDYPVVISENATPEEYLRLRNTVDWRDMLSHVWHIGIVVVGIAFLASNLSFGRRLRRSRREIDVSTSILPVYVCEGLKTPCLFGLFRPAIYITPEVEADNVKLRHVLAHETTHYRHGDNIWAVLRGACLALHWYNPLVWWAASLSRRDAETACDAGAIRRLGEEQRADYGRTLIGLTVKKAGRFDMLCCATTMTGSGKVLKERITMIAKNPKTKIAALAALVVAIVVAVVCLFTGAKAEQEPVSETPNASLLRGTILDIDLRDSGYGYLVDIEWSGGRFLEGDQAWVRAAGLEPSPEPMVGDKVEVLFGETLERVLEESTQPPILNDAKGIHVVDQWLDGYYTHGMSFSGLMPGEEKAYERTLELDGTKPVYYQVSWARAGMDVEVGLRAADGGEFSALLSEGTGEGYFRSLPAGKYTFFVRNDESNLEREVSSNAELTVGGTVAFGDYYLTEYEVTQTPAPSEYVIREGDLLPSNAQPVTVRVDFTPEGGVPQAAIDWARAIAQANVTGFAAPVSPDRGYRVIDAKLTGVTPVGGSAALGAAVEMYRVEWRILFDHPENVVLSGGMNIDNGWVTEEGSYGQPYIALFRYFDSAGRERWERLGMMNTDLLAEYGTPELLDKYGDRYTAACAAMLEEENGGVFPEVTEIARADLDRDGREEDIVLTSRPVTRTYTLRVLDADGNELYRDELSTSHAGWGKYFLCTLEGEDYLLYYNPAMSTGVGYYEYQLFDLENGRKQIVRSDGVEFMMAGPDMLNLPAKEMAAFADEINALLEQSTLLVNVTAEVKTGPGSAAAYYEDYAILLDDAGVDFRPGLSLEAKIAAYEDYLREQWGAPSAPRSQPGNSPAPTPVPTAPIPTVKPLDGYEVIPTATPMPPVDFGPDFPNLPTSDMG